jgi:hypothetical protein
VIETEGEELRGGRGEDRGEGSGAEEGIRGRRKGAESRN